MAHQPVTINPVPMKPEAVHSWVKRFGTRRTSGGTKEVIYDDGKKTGEIRQETTIFGTPVKREYDNDGNRVSETRRESTARGFGDPVYREYGPDGRLKSEMRREKIMFGFGPTGKRERSKLSSTDAKHASADESRSVTYASEYGPTAVDPEEDSRRGGVAHEGSRRGWSMVVMIMMLVVVGGVVVWSVVERLSEYRPAEYERKSETQASVGRPLVGAIRWDAWNNGLHADGTAVGLDAEKVLGPQKWHYRLPFYGRELSSTQVEIRSDSQAVMDEEIRYAKAAGLDYWAFGWDPDDLQGVNHPMGRSRRLYLSSSHKSDIKFTVLLGSKISTTTSFTAELIQAFREPTYVYITVAGVRRPLVYYFHGSPGLTKSEADTFRDRVMQAGIANPYIVSLHWVAGQAAQFANQLGFDAIGAYAVGGGQGAGLFPYSQLTTVAQKFWHQGKNLGKKVVPIVMTGWDPRPLVETPVWWAKPTIFAYVQATPQEIANHLQAALNWSAANPVAASEPNAILIYAWNEIAEGGWLLPSNPATNPVGTGRLDAIGAVLGAPVSAPDTTAPSVPTGPLRQRRILVPSQPHLECCL